MQFYESATMAGFQIDQSIQELLKIENMSREIFLQEEI